MQETRVNRSFLVTYREPVILWSLNVDRYKDGSEAVEFVAPAVSYSIGTMIQDDKSRSFIKAVLKYRGPHSYSFECNLEGEIERAIVDIKEHKFACYDNDREVYRCLSCNDYFSTHLYSKERKTAEVLVTCPRCGTKASIT